MRWRVAEPDWSAADAQRWLAGMVIPSVRQPAPCTAVMWTNRCLMWLRDGLLVDAVVERPSLMTSFATRIPAVVLGALLRTDPAGRTSTKLSPTLLPDALLITCFGHGHDGHDGQRHRVHLDTSAASSAFR